MEVVVTTGAISRAKLQSNHHHQQTNNQFFYRSDAIPIAQPTMSKHWRENITFHGLAYPKLTWGLPTLSLTTNSSWLPWGRCAMPLISPLIPVPLVEAVLIDRCLQPLIIRQAWMSQKFVLPCGRPILSQEKNNFTTPCSQQTKASNKKIPNDYPGNALATKHKKKTAASNVKLTSLSPCNAVQHFASPEAGNDASNVEISKKTTPKKPRKDTVSGLTVSTWLYESATIAHI